MAERDDLRELGHAWRGITDEVELSVGDALRRQGRESLVLLLEGLFGLLGLAAAAYFWLADDQLVHRVAALVLVASVASHAIAKTRSRVSLLKWADWTPEGVLTFRLRHCEAALRTAWGGFFGSAVLAAFAGFVWLAVVLGWDTTLPPGFAALYARVVAVSVAVVCGWSVWRLTVKRTERARLQALLAEFERA